MVKMVEFKEYRAIPVDDAYRTIYVNPNNVNYIYAVTNAGKDMTVIVFIGGEKTVVLGNMTETKKILENAEN